MEAILALHAKALQKQREELAKRVVANNTQHEADMPHVRASLQTFYSQLAQLADIDIPDGQCVLWSNDQATQWLREEFVRGFTRQVVESYQATHIH